MRIAFSNDHAALDQREGLIGKLKALGHEVTDFGACTAASVDYPDFALPAVEAFCRGEVDRVVLVCGSGIGMSIVANRFPCVRCALVTDLFAAEMSRRHNDANCLSLRTREQAADLNQQILEVWLNTPFEGGRHQKRLDKIETLSLEALRCTTNNKDGERK
jgi:ribose 5-phosphate isomerase B